MKKIIFLIIMLFGLLYINTFAEKEYIAVPTNSKVLVDGKEIDFAAYNIGGNNYFKLRDLAIVLRDTDRGFDISIKSDNGKDLISLKPTSNKFPMQKYQPIGTELQKSGEKTKVAILNVTDSCGINDDFYDARMFTIYKIDGYNYFKLREIAYTFNFSVEWDEKLNCIVIDTKKPYKFSSYKAILQEDGFEIGSVYEYEKPVFIDDFPIIAYRIETDKREISESQALRRTEHFALKDVYLFVEDLVNYGFDIKYSDDKKTMYIVKNDSKKFGMMDGEIVNSHVKTDKIFSLYPAKKHVILNDMEIFNYSTGDKTLIPALEFVQYYTTDYKYYTIDAIRIDMIKKFLNDAFDVLPQKECVRLDLYKHLMPFTSSFDSTGSFCGSFIDGKANGVSKAEVKNGLNWETNHNFIGYYNEDKINGVGIYIEEHSGMKLIYQSYMKIKRGKFVDNDLYDGIIYQSVTSVDMSWLDLGTLKNGFRIEGSMKNGYKRESVIYNDGKNKSDRNLRFGYVVQCEGEVQNGEYCGYYRQYDENGKMIFEGQYTDYINIVKN